MVRANTIEDITENYNTFDIPVTELPRVLEVFRSGWIKATIKNVGESLIKLLSTGKDDSNTERVILDGFTGIYIICVEERTEYFVGHGSRFLISMDDGMPSKYAYEVKEILDREGITYKLN